MQSCLWGHSSEEEEIKLQLEYTFYDKYAIIVFLAFNREYGHSLLQSLLPYNSTATPEKILRLDFNLRDVELVSRQDATCQNQQLQKIPATSLKYTCLEDCHG